MRSGNALWENFPPAALRREDDRVRLVAFHLKTDLDADVLHLRASSVLSLTMLF
jgi:hypothetical protein